VPDPIGGVYYVALDLKTITPVLPRLAGANGVALSPDGKTLWVTEYLKGLLHKIQLSGPGTVLHMAPQLPNSSRERPIPHAWMPTGTSM
jgi:sugar lactone lactonase YvrE